MTLMKASGIGADRVGIVYAITNTITLHQGNILHLNSLQVAGDYAITLVAEFPETETMRTAIRDLHALPIVEGFLISAGEIASDDHPMQEGTKYVITAMGHDRTGILESFSKSFWQRGITLQSVQAGIAAHVPFTGTPMFKCEFTVTLPALFAPEPLFEELVHTAVENELTLHITPIP